MSSIIRVVHREIAVHRFMGIVRREAKKSRVVILYGDSGPTDRCGWRKWMAEPEFRNHVLARCSQQPHLENARFAPPDEYDDWTFAVYVKEDKRPWA